MANYRYLDINGLTLYDNLIKNHIDAKINKLITNTILEFFCIKPVDVILNGETLSYEGNTNVYLTLNTHDTFEIIPSSNDAIITLSSYPGALGTFFPWLEGVSLFDGILFDMNSTDMYTKWNQGNQGLYHVQFAQYKNCIFWSDNPYISDVALRTNYTLYYSSELPLCYSTIPDNTFKSFYFAYNVTCDPNWSNPAYKESFSKATWATQVFSYYGLHSIGVFDMDSSRFNITLPKDCRGLMFYAPNILNAGVFDAINVTDFGAKSGSWRDAFAYCYQLTNLYIKNLKVNLNVSWSPINQQSLEFILSKAANTNKITIYLSPHTYFGLTDENKTLAAEKNIVLSLIATNTSEDVRLHMLQISGDGNGYLANDGTYKTITIPEMPSLDGYAKLEDINAYANYTGNSTNVSVTTSHGYFPTELIEGAKVIIKIEGDITTIKTLNVNNTGAKNVYYKGSTLANNTINKYNIYEFVFDGTHYRIIGIDTNTHYTSKIVVASDNLAESNTAATNGNVYLNIVENSTVRSSHKIIGSGAVNVTADDSGTISIDANMSYVVENHTNEEILFELTPNTLHVWPEVASLELSLSEEIPNICNEYIFQFTSGETPTMLILPDNILWVNDIPEIEANKIYQCSILNNIAVICGV